MLLDTAAILAVDSEGLQALGEKGRQIVSDLDHDLLISVISITEIAVKTSIGKLESSAGVVSKIAIDLQAKVIDYESRHANRLFDLPLYHRDPFDRMLIATALLEGCPVLTSDRVFAKYGLQVIW